jgi:hypothetical protein
MTRPRGGDIVTSVETLLANVDPMSPVNIRDWRVEHCGDPSSQLPYSVAFGSAYLGRFRSMTAAVVMVLDIDKSLTLADIRW